MLTAADLRPAEAVRLEVGGVVFHTTPLYAKEGTALFVRLAAVLAGGLGEKGLSLESLAAALARPDLGPLVADLSRMFGERSTVEVLQDDGRVATPHVAKVAEHLWARRQVLHLRFLVECLRANYQDFFDTLGIGKVAPPGVPPATITG